MPAAPPAPPPAAAPPAGVTIIGERPPAPPPPPTSEIHVSGMPASASPPPPPKKGSAREQMREALRQKAGTEAEPTPKPAAPKKTDSPAPAAVEPKPGEGGAEDSPPAPGQGAPAAAGTPPAAAPDKKGAKPNPWKLLDAEKAARGKVEQEFQEYRSKVPRDVDVKALSERAQKAEEAAAKLADEIRYHNYEKSPEFQQQFQEPYVAAFRQAMSDLSEVTVQDPTTGQVRKFTDDDLAQLSFMPLTQAKETATRLFPDFADDIMAARKEIRGLWDKRQRALEEWKGKGAERAKQALEQQQRQRGELATAVKTDWEAFNAGMLANEQYGHLFRPREGDPEWNSRLEKGFKLADEAFAANLLDPDMKPEDRKKAVERYAAVRARAAGWSALRYENGKLQGRVKELEAELAKYKETVPPAGGTDAGQAAPAGHISAREVMRQELRKRAV